MNLGTVYHWIYCLPLPRAALLAVLCVGNFLLIRSVWGCRAGWRWLCAGALAVWALVVLHLTLLGRDPGTVSEPAWIPFHSYTAMIQTGNREILRSNFMNTALFLPGGLLLGQLLPRTHAPWVRALTALGLLILFSLGVEACQYATCRGLPEMDDLIHNALGGALGIAPDLLFPRKKK